MWTPAAMMARSERRSMITITSMDTTPPKSRDRLRQIKSLRSSSRALKSRHNQLVPISRLPCEVLSAIFSLLPVFAWNEGSSHLAWIYVAHVCRRWRETVLSYPRFWSHINLTKLTPVGVAEILSRAKMAPLHLEASYTEQNAAHFEAFERQLNAHISHTRHLKFSGHYLSNVVKWLVPPAPTLESLSLSQEDYLNRITPICSTILDDFFNCTAPNLTSLKLENCYLNWKSPLLKGLRILEVLDHLSVEVKPELNDWLDALNEMPQLKELSLQYSTPVAASADRLVSRTVTLPSLTHFHINSTAEDCALALAHLLLPTLTWLHVDIESEDEEGEDVRQLIPYVARNVHVPQDIKPIRSVLVAGERTCAEVLTWTTPGADVKVCGPDTFNKMSRSACLVFTAKADGWNRGVDTTIFDALLTLLPMNSVSTFTIENYTRLSKEFWLRHSSRMPLLEQARLVPPAISAFGAMLAEDISLDSDGPRLPMLTKLILLHVTLSPYRVIHLRNILIERVEQGVPLDYLDLRTCVVANCAIQLLAEIVVDVQGPQREARSMSMTGYHGHHNEDHEIGFDDVKGTWYGDVDYSEDEEYEDEDDNEDEDEDDDDDYDNDNYMGYSW